MIIAVSSNIVSAIYMVLCDLVLPIALTALVQVFLSNWNVTRIYKERKPLHLTSTRLSFLSHQDVTERFIGNLTAILSTIIIVLAVSGSFSIDGISRREAILMATPVAIDRGSGNDLIDFTQHVSRDGILVSGSFLMAHDALSCGESNSEMVITYAAINDIYDLTSVKWPKESLMYNSTCLMTELGFSDKPSLRFKVQRRAPLPPGQISIETETPFTLSRATVQVHGSNLFTTQEFWCSYNIDFYCVGSVKFKEGFTTYIAQYEKPSDGGGQPRVIQRNAFSPLHSDEKMEEISIRSMAYLLSTRVVPMGFDIERRLSMQAIYKNVDVEKEGDIVEATEINLVHLMTTLGVSLVLTGAFGVASFMSWRRNVRTLEVEDCNKFYSAHDMLKCAAREASKKMVFQKQNRGLIIGMSADETHVGPLPENENIYDNSWEETG